jgi:hypothetical protein
MWSPCLEEEEEEDDDDDGDGGDYFSISWETNSGISELLVCIRKFPGSKHGLLTWCPV